MPKEEEVVIPGWPAWKRDALPPDTTDMADSINQRDTNIFKLVKYLKSLWILRCKINS